MTEALLRKRLPHHFEDPKIDASAYVAEGARITGDVRVGAKSSIWYNCVLRGDVNFIQVGEMTNVQDLTMIHCTYHGNPAVLGNGVTVGHSVTLHACTIGDYALVGMQSVVLDEAELGEMVLLGAGSLVPPKMKIPPKTKAFGRPAKVVADLNQKEVDYLRWSADHYWKIAEAHRLRFGDKRP